jgi:hypothetical protein
MPTTGLSIRNSKIAKEILAGEHQAEDHPHNHNRGDAALFEDVALLQ